MNGWWALAGAVVLAAVAAVREYLRWRGRRWQGGLRSGARPDDD